MGKLTITQFESDIEDAVRSFFRDHEVAAGSVFHGDKGIDFAVELCLAAENSLETAERPTSANTRARLPLAALTFFAVGGGGIAQVAKAAALIGALLYGGQCIKEFSQVGTEAPVEEVVAKVVTTEPVESFDKPWSISASFTLSTAEIVALGSNTNTTQSDLLGCQLAWNGTLCNMHFLLMADVQNDEHKAELNGMAVSPFKSQVKSRISYLCFDCVPSKIRTIPEPSFGCLLVAGGAAAALGAARRRH